MPIFHNPLPFNLNNDLEVEPLIISFQHLIHTARGPSPLAIKRYSTLCILLITGMHEIIEKFKY